MHKKLSRNERNVRRNLKFLETPLSVTKTEKCAKANINNENNNLKKENLRLSTRKSFLLPPNTIKELHVKNKFKQNRSEVSQFRILTMNSENIQPRIFKASESCLFSMEDTNAHADSAVHVKKNKSSIIQSASSQTFNINEQSGINILHSSNSDLADTSNSAVKEIPENLNSNEISNVNICGSENNDCNIIINGSYLSSVDDTNAKIDANLNDIEQNDIRSAERHSRTICILPNVEKVKEASSNEKVIRERCSFTTTNIYEDLHPSLQTVKAISESCLNNFQCVNEDEHVTLSKTELTNLASKLKHLVCRLEEDVSDLKLTLTTVTKLLSVTDVTNKKIKETIHNNETKITRQIIEITEDLNDNMKMMDNMDTKLPCVTIIDMKHDNALKETRKMLDINRSNFLETNKDNLEMQLSDQMYTAGNNKENEEILNSPIVKQCEKLKSGTRRRSARLAKKILKNSHAANDSFVNLENELDIVNRKSTMPITTFINQTPAKNKHQDKKIENRPMKEYMVLKSRMSCLLTPNIKRFNPSESKNTIHRETDDAKISVSDKLLAELYNLYEDSI